MFIRKDYSVAQKFTSVLTLIFITLMTQIICRVQAETSPTQGNSHQIAEEKPTANIPASTLEEGPAGKSNLSTSSPFVSPNTTPGIGLPPLNIPQPAPSTTEETQKSAEFKVGLPPLLTSETLSISAVPATTLFSPYGVFDKIDEGLQAIKQERRPGILLLTNPRDEFDQRVELILGLPAFKNVIPNMVIIRLDIDKDPQAMMHYGFYKTPSFVLFDSEGNVRRKIQSVTDIESLLQEFKNLK